MPEQPEPAAGSAVASYFQPPQGYFWRWAEGNEVVEWLNGTTITYREELAALLTGLAPMGLPPLGAVLLLLAACNSAWQNSSAEIGLLQGLLRGLPPGGPPDEELTFHLSVACRFLDIIRELPIELRQGVAKEHLLREILVARTRSRLVPAQQAKQLASDLVNYTESELINSESQLGRWHLQADLLCFDRAAQRFPTVHSLELRLRTGLDQLPEPLAETPAPPPAPESADLLAELAQDARTAGLARLVPHLRAALHLPHTAPQASAQPLGGVADLSNRGPLDRLLLSELAQDDLSLLARLAHGEALYLRREAPPLPQPPPRVLLLDITLLMWGLPRVAGLAAALALAAPGHAEPPQAFALWSHHAQLLDLRSRAGVVAALGLLDPALHCGAALAAVLPMLPAPAEALLITEAQAARQPDFLAALASAPATLRFLLTVARSGELVLYELRGGQRIILSSSQIALEKLLFDLPQPQRPGTADLVLPAFLREKKAPLFFPTTSFQASPALLCYDSGQSTSRGLVGVTQQQRVLYWPHSYLGALEALPMVEEGAYLFGFSSQQPKTIYLLVTQVNTSQNSLLLLYVLKPWEGSCTRSDWSEQVPPGTRWATLLYHNDSFILKSTTQQFTLSCQHEALTTHEFDPPPLPIMQAQGMPPATYFNPGYGVLQQTKQLSISKKGYLLISNYELVAESDTVLTLRASSSPHLGRHAATSAGTYPLAANPRVRLRRWVWPDGSEALIDSRGLLHLRSANAALPELTLVLATNRATAAWEAGGHKCGWAYFIPLTQKTDAAHPETLPVNEFYNRYLQPFIDQILS